MMHSYSLMFYDRWDDRWNHSGKFPRQGHSSPEDYLSSLRKFCAASEANQKIFSQNQNVLYRVVYFESGAWHNTSYQAHLFSLLQPRSNIAEIET
jgi:hypothetical protein